MEAHGYRQTFNDTLGDWRWRLNNLYWITDKEGRRVKFQMNWAQETLFKEMHHLNVILKARQLGFTTFIQLFMLDACVFKANIRAGTIAHRLEDAQAIFRDKIKFPYDNLPEAIRAAAPLIKDSVTELLLANNSSIRVSTSHRSGTLNYLHVSEYGWTCAKHPDKAREIRTGALNTLQQGQVAFIESTAEGQEGHFYELCLQAQSKQRIETPLTPLDFKFHFFPWWKNREYQLDPTAVPIPEGHARYFEKLEQTQGIALSAAQQAWYCKKAETQLADMKREYPSTPEEAFEASIEGAYFADQLAAAEMQGRIGEHRLLQGVPVNTAWDIGVGDYTSIWLWQQTAGKIGLIGYYQNCGEGMPHYIEHLKAFRNRTGCTFGSHVFPHDVKVREWGSSRTRIEQFVESDLDPRIDARVAARQLKDDAINAARQTLSVCWFDAVACDEGLKALRSYRKEWDEEKGIWRDTPRHDRASHGADAFQTLAVWWREMRDEEATETLEARVRREQAECARAIEQLSRPKTIDELFEERELELAED
jgi:hypothetical protein